MSVSSSDRLEVLEQTSTEGTYKMRIDHAITDVQVNGTSVANGGIANIQFNVVSVTSSTTNISANGTAWISIAKPANTISIVGFYIAGTNNTTCYLYAQRFDGGNIQFAVKNAGTATASVTLTAYVLVFQ